MGAIVMVKSKSDIAFDSLVFLILLLVGLICLVPVLYVISMSLTPATEVARAGGFVLIPRSLTTIAYTKVLSTEALPRAMFVNIGVTVVGTLMSLTVTMLGAYPLSREDLPGRGVLVKIAVFTMLFGAGTIPTYLVVRGTGLINTYWSLIIPSLVSTYNLIVMKAFFEGLSKEMFESARIDGASEMKVLIRIVLPLSLPIMLTIGLYYAVGYWNTYMHGLLYITNSSKYPLQVVVRRLLAALVAYEEEGTDIKAIPSETIKMASVVVATLPVVVVYPFIQKYFTKGTLVGAVKG